MNHQPERRKGIFGDAKLPVAKDYLYPRRRRWLVWLGLIAAAAILAFALVDFLIGGAGFLSGGPLSSSHANLGNDCASCHSDFTAVADTGCISCHEKYGDRLGVYSFAAHYLYRSSDFQRLELSADEVSCATCHTEHGGREASIIEVADARCQTCHEFGSFNRGHPQIEPVTPGQVDPAGLSFAHIRHVNEVMETRGLADVERACLYCHNPRSDGRSFEPINFDLHCDACHLSTSVKTPRLPIGSPSGPEPGVATLETIRSAGRPDTEWAFYANPNEFRQVGSRVSKSPVHHEDPWIMDNLRQLRRALYPDTGLSDLLQTSPEVPASELRGLYAEAVDTLERYATGLRARPEPAVQEDLARIEALLQGVERDLRDPYIPLDETEMLLAFAGGAPPSTEVEELITDLTQPCGTCHIIDHATIRRVQKEQRSLFRAEFNHRTHILARRCLDCHTAIPIREALAGEVPENVESDHAGVYNLPSIETCQECHSAELVSNSCVTCHLFHPDKSRRAELLLYLE